MRALLGFLGLGREGSESDGAAQTATVRKIVARLEALPENEARYVACFAYLLGRVAHADLEISGEESQAMEALVVDHSGLGEAQAVLVVEIAKRQNRLFGGTENFLVTRELAAITDEAQRRDLLHCLFAVSTADGSISGEEEEQIRQIAEELGMRPATFLEIRGQYNKQRSVIQRLDARDGEAPNES